MLNHADLTKLEHDPSGPDRTERLHQWGEFERRRARAVAHRAAECTRCNW